MCLFVCKIQVHSQVYCPSKHDLRDTLITKISSMKTPRVSLQKVDYKVDIPNSQYIAINANRLCEMT